ncbi:MAG: hypothetical protein ABUS57_17380, partial [Pseudomonadota bacterium]
MNARAPRPRGVILSLVWLTVFTTLSMGVMIAATAALLIGFRGGFAVRGMLPTSLFEDIFRFSIVMAVLSVGMAAGITIFSALRDGRGLRALGMRSAGLRPGLAWFGALLAIHLPLCALLAIAYGPAILLQNLAYLLAITPFVALHAGAEEVMFRGWL